METQDSNRFRDWLTLEHILYFVMGASAAAFASADVIAEFDADPNTRTATSYVKMFRDSSPLAFIFILLGCVELALHFLVDGWPA